MKYNAVVITVSDTCYSGQKEDKSGPALADALQQAGYDVGALEIVPDELNAIHTVLEKYLQDQRCHLIMTTGGTGFGPRDVTPEATRQLIEKPAPGLAEFLRQAGAAQTSLTWLSRGEAGVARGKLIINLPGSPKAMAHSIHSLRELLQHALDLINGGHPH